MDPKVTKIVTEKIIRPKTLVCLRCVIITKILQQIFEPGFKRFRTFRLFCSVEVKFESEDAGRRHGGARPVQDSGPWSRPAQVSAPAPQVLKPYSQAAGT